MPNEIKELEYKIHSIKVYIYTACTQELEDIKKNKITDEEILDNFFERMSCLAADEWFYNLCYKLINYVETFDRYLGGNFRTKLKIYLDDYYEQKAKDSKQEIQ